MKFDDGIGERVVRRTELQHRLTARLGFYRDNFFCK